MDLITINTQERDQLREWLMFLEGPLGDLKMALAKGSDDLGGVDRREMTSGFIVLDRIGWELKGTADRYRIPVSPWLLQFVEAEREIAVENCDWDTGGDSGLEAIAEQEQAKARTERAIASQMLRTIVAEVA